MLTPMVNLPFQPIPWGAEPHDFTKQAGGEHQLQLNVYTKETTQRYVFGTRSMTWDGRVFRYARCGRYAITNNKYGVGQFTVLVANKIASAGDTNEVVMTDALVGDTSIKVTFDAGSLGNIGSGGVGTHTGILAEHELCGGYISLWTGNYRQQRGIIGNTETDANSTSMIIYLDAPLEHVITFGTSFSEILANPYCFVGKTDSMWVSIVGVPTVTAAVGDCLWLQTWGPLRITGVVTTLGVGTYQRQYIFGSNGAILPIGQRYGSSYSEQFAGFLLEQTTGVANYSAAPFIMLQICP